ncbi:MAG: SIS domain-containing protein, partial [Pisciglobus halotolerans]|nr:SIS domain-containing protein [Pisciglobus halotolerans]
LKETLKEINSYNITKAASLIKSSNHIELFGVGASLPSSIDIARKLTFTGKLASARSDWDELRVVANHLNKDDLAILISHSGETLHLIEYATILKRSEVPFILLVGTSDSYIESLATLTLYGYSESVYYGDIDMSSRFTIYLLMDLVLFNYLDSFKD